MPLLVKRPLIWIDIADRSPDNIRGVKPATEIVDGPISIVIGFLHLDFLVMFDLRHDCNVAIASIIPSANVPGQQKSWLLGHKTGGVTVVCGLLVHALLDSGQETPQR